MKNQVGNGHPTLDSQRMVLGIFAERRKPAPQHEPLTRCGLAYVHKRAWEFFWHNRKTESSYSS